MWRNKTMMMVTSPPPAPDMSVADGLFLCRDPTFKRISIYAKAANMQGFNMQKNSIAKGFNMQKNSIAKGFNMQKNSIAKGFYMQNDSIRFCPFTHLHILANICTCICSPLIEKMPLANLSISVMIVWTLENILTTIFHILVVWMLHIYGFKNVL